MLCRRVCGVGRVHSVRIWTPRALSSSSSFPLSPLVPVNWQFETAKGQNGLEGLKSRPDIVIDATYPSAGSLCIEKGSDGIRTLQPVRGKKQSDKPHTLADLKKFLQAATKLVRDLPDAQHLALRIPADLLANVTPAALPAQIHQALYTDTRFKGAHQGEADVETAPEWTISVVVQDNSNSVAAKIVNEMNQNISRSHAMRRGTSLARDMVNAPGNILTPAAIAEVAEGIAARHPHSVAIRVLERAECEAMGMGAFLGVARGSAKPPKLVHLTIEGTDPTEAHVALVGKGLTFDSGGYNLKPGNAMIELMKFDMGGAAAVLGAAEALATLKPAVTTHFIVAACENMISGDAMRPGDILTAANGKTIEVDNTDAEGRLTLADALYYAEKHVGAKTIVDVATLTGAVVVALGGKVAGYMTPCDEMAARVELAAKEADEKVWRLPLEAEYREILKSDLADMKNSGMSREAGSITAGLFLQDFVETEKWAHIDIAGTVWDKGATGYGVRMLTNFALTK